MEKTTSTRPNIPAGFSESYGAGRAAPWGQLRLPRLSQALHLLDQRRLALGLFGLVHPLRVHPPKGAGDHAPAFRAAGHDHGQTTFGQPRLRGTSPFPFCDQIDALQFGDLGFEGLDLVRLLLLLTSGPTVLPTKPRLGIDRAGVRAIPEEARRVRAAVRKKGVVFQFGTQQRSEWRFRLACELALNGRLGKLQEIQVSVPAGKSGPAFSAQPVPDYVDWNRWVGPAPLTTFHEAMLQRDNHENMTQFSLGMISCWGIHHLDIAQWGNGADATGPSTVEGTGEFPRAGGFDAIERWKVRFEYADAAPMVFVSDGTPGFSHGVRFVGSSGWVHVVRGDIKASDEKLLEDPENKVGTMPLKLAISGDHTRNFLGTIKNGGRAICDIEASVRSDTLCQLALIAVKQGRKLQWNPQSERFVNDDAANARLQPRPFRGEWKLAEL